MTRRPQALSTWSRQVFTFGDGRRVVLCHRSAIHLDPPKSIPVDLKPDDRPIVVLSREAPSPVVASRGSSGRPTASTV